MALLTNINGKFSVSDAGAVTFNNAFTFPTTDGTANYILKTNGSGQLAWAPDSNSGDITGSGTANTVTKFTGAKVIGDGPITFSSNDSAFAGNVGIGTGSGTLDEIFEIKSGNGAGGDPATNAPVMKITNNTTTSSWVSGNKIGGIEYWTRDPSGNAPYATSFINSINDQPGTNVLPSGALVFGTATYNAVGGAVERMRIDSSGNVGIGTTSPDNITSTGTVLSISTAGALTTDGLAGSLTFLTNDASFTNTYADGVTTEISSICESTTGAAYGLAFSTSTITSTNRAERMRIASNGAIKFNDYGSGTFTGTEAYRLAVDSSGNVIEIQDGGGTVTGSGTATQVAFWDTDTSLSGNDDLYWDNANGCLGINDATPNSRLKVIGAVGDTSVYTVDINHIRNNPDVATHAMRLNVDLSGADNTTADRTNSGLFLDIDSSANGDASNEHRIYGVNADVRFSGFSDQVRGGYFLAESNYTGAKTAQLVGVYGYAIHDANDAAGGVSNMYGVYGHSSIQDTGDVDTAFGVYGLVTISTNRIGDVGVTKAVEGEIQIDKDTAINYGTMIGISSVIDNNEGSVPNFGTQYLFKGDYQGDKGANAYGIWTEGDKNYFSGNVGIGTSLPSEKLHVNSGTANSVALFESTDTAAIIKIKDTTGEVRIETRNDFRFSNNAGANELMRIDSSGNVGIGTTSPGTVHGVSYGTTKLHIDGGTDRGQLVIEGDSLAGIAFSDNGATANQRVFYQSINGGLFNIKPLNDNGTGTASSGISMLHNGNVGIGTDSPDNILHIRKGDTGYASQVGADTMLFLETTNVSNALQFTSANTGQQYIMFGDDDPNTGWISYNHSDNNLNFRVNATERMRIDSSGNVGIGTNNPSGDLHVVGKAGTAGRLYISDVDVGSSGTDSVLAMKLDTHAYYYNRDSGDLYLGTNNVAGQLTIKPTGNVGIGTTSPSGLLHIKLGSINVFHANSVCGNVGIKLSNADITSIQDAAFTVKGNMSYAYTNYTQVAFTYTNVIDFNGFPAGVYQLNLCTQSNASSYGVFTIKWSGSAGTVINTLVSGGTNGGYGLSFSGTVLRSISNVNTDTAANLQCLVTYEACQP